jgi:hypothetical protein
MGLTSQATIIPNSVLPGDPNPNDYPHIFQSSGCTVQNSLPASCLGNLSKTFSRSVDASGIGDIVIRAKGTLWKGEHLGIAAAADFRLATGDETNFLGSGTWGVKPFVIVSYKGRISPHVNLGYEWNGDSILAGSIDVSSGTSTKAHLPNEFLYTVGADVGITRRLTANADFLGQRVFDGYRLSTRPFTDQGQVTGVSGGTVQVGTQHTFSDLSQPSTGSFDIRDLALGAKFSPFSRWLITGNVIIKLDDGGLRAKVVPLVGVSYTF